MTCIGFISIHLINIIMCLQSMNLETAIKEVMKILKQVMEEKLTSKNVEVIVALLC